VLCKIKFKNSILPKPLKKWLVEALFSVSTNYNHYSMGVPKNQVISVCSLFGGIVSGLGIGLTIRNGGAIDGVAVLAILFSKRAKLP
jgi:uncharacterized membrane-anchored protein YitT (DUF2179 family)